MLRLFFLLFVPVLLLSNEVELFCDYISEAKGQEIFPLDEGLPEKDLTLTSLLRRKLRERGDEIRSWELEKHKPYLLSFKGVESFQDLKHWLGFGVDKEKTLDANYWMFWNLGPKLAGIDLSKVPREKLILVMWEPPSVQEELYNFKTQDLFGKIFTWDDDLVDNEKYFKFHYPALKPRMENIPTFEEKKFSVMISRRLTSRYPKELYSERKRVIKFFEGRSIGEFDLYGYRWKKKYKNYKGPTKDKLETLKEYKYSFCYENTGDVKGYITEKIFDCFAAGVVPIYLGASNVTDYIPKECFIDRREFSNNEELIEHLKGISKEEYQQYLDHAATYLKSDEVKVFTNAYFVENVLSKI